MPGSTWLWRIKNKYLTTRKYDANIAKSQNAEKVDASVSHIVSLIFVQQGLHKSIEYRDNTLSIYVSLYTYSSPSLIVHLYQFSFLMHLQLLIFLRIYICLYTLIYVHLVLLELCPARETAFKVTAILSVHSLSPGSTFVIIFLGSWK